MTNKELNELDKVNQPPTQKQPLILDRVRALEELTNGLAGFVEHEIMPLKNALANMVKIVNGIIAASGEGFEKKVQDAISQAEKDRADRQIERDKALIAELVKQGVLEAAETVGELSIIVGREFDAKGNLLGIGRAQVRFDQFAESVREKVLGQGVGFVIEVETGKFEVLEIYNQVPPKPPEVAEPEPTKLEVKDPETPVNTEVK